MANPEHVEIVKKGADAIRKWREENPSSSFDLRHSDLSTIDLSNCDLDGADFRGAILKDTDFISAILSNSNMEGVNLRQLDLTRVNLFNANLNGATLNDATLNDANLKNSNLSDSHADGAKLSGANLTIADLKNSFLDHANLNKATLSGANLTGAFLVDAILTNADVSYADLTNAILSRADLSGANLTGATLEGANLCGANLLNTIIDSTTKFDSETRVVGCKVDRYTLEYMKSAGISKGQLMDMVVTDDIARLRMQFSGVWMWGHLISLFVFCAPYGWFLFQQWSVAEFPSASQTDPEVLTIFYAFLRYIWNGGIGWQEGWNLHWQSLQIFVFMLLYQFVRSLLLVKTIRLETQERVTGLPFKFSLGNIGGTWKKISGWNLSQRAKQCFKYISHFESYANVSWWAICYEFVLKAYCVMILVAVINTLHFMSMEVPTTNDTMEKFKQPASVFKAFIPNEIAIPSLQTP